MDFDNVTSVKIPEGNAVQIYDGSHVIFEPNPITGTAPLNFCAEGNPLVEYSIAGKTVQSGTPTPDVPIDVLGVGDRTANLWTITPNAQIGYNQNVGSDVSESAGTLLVSASDNGMILTAGASWANTAWKIQATVGVTYYISFGSLTSNLRVTIYATDGNNKVTRKIANYSSNFPSNKEITILPDEQYIVISFSVNVISTVEVTSPMIATNIIPYESYGYKVTTTNRGKNLFDYRTAYASYINADGDVESVNLTNIQNGLGDFVGKTITIRIYCKIVTATRVFIRANINGSSSGHDSNEIRQGNTGYMTLTVTPETTNDYWILTYGSRGTGDVYSDFMLNLGSTATPYEPYREPITTTVYLGQTQTVRKIQKQIFDGNEDWRKSGDVAYLNNFGVVTQSPLMCTHFPNAQVTGIFNAASWIFIVNITHQGFSTLDEWIAYLQQQYTAGTPVTVWYIPETPETAIVNEPLMKIGDYADELRSTEAGISIPTVTGANTLTVGTTVQPSQVSVKTLD